MDVIISDHAQLQRSHSNIIPKYVCKVLRCPDPHQLSPLNTPQNQVEYFVQVLPTHVTMVYQLNQNLRRKYISLTVSVSLWPDQGHHNWYEWEKNQQRYHHANIERFAMVCWLPSWRCRSLQKLKWTFIWVKTNQKKDRKKETIQFIRTPAVISSYSRHSENCFSKK